MTRSTTALIALLPLLFLGGCGKDDSEADKGSRASSQGSCREVDAPAPKPDGGQSKSKRKLDAGSSYDLVLQTSCGDITIRLDLEDAPNTSASLVSLARSGFYDDTVFHRIVPDFVIQGGDPTGTGTGGPGYKTVDVPPSDARYLRGVVSMAKTGAEAPGTSGSQFYIVTGADAGLPPEYAIVGKVTDGMDTVDRIEALGQSGSELPSRPVVIEKATVKQR